MRLSDYCKRWSWPGVGNYVSRRWRKDRMSLLSRPLQVCGDHLLSDIKPRHLWEIQRRCTADGCTAATANRVVHGALAALLRDAALDGHITHKFRRELFGSVRRLPEVANPSRAPFTQAERDAILGELDASYPRATPLAAFLFTTGMRVSEALGLAWGDVDLARQLCVIRRGRVGRTFTPCKTKHSQRRIQIAQSAVTAIASLPRSGYRELIFVGARGRPLDLHNYSSRWWRPAVAALGNVPIRPLYATRHSWISYQLESGQPITDVARHAGTSPDIIREHYFEYTREWEEIDWDAALNMPTLRLVRRKEN